MSIVKNGGAFFDDTFNDGIAPPDSPNPILYNTSGIFSGTGDRAIMDGILAGPAIGVGTPDEFVGHFATVRSNINPADTALGLKIDDDFTVAGRFDLIQPDDRREAYGIRLTDRLRAAPATRPIRPAMTRSSLWCAAATTASFACS